LKGQYGGELLTAIGRDANDQMLPIAYAVVEVENKDTWSWFLKLLIEDLGGADVCRFCTFMSDQQKVICFHIFLCSLYFYFFNMKTNSLVNTHGLLPVIQELLPGAKQRFCMRHLYNNFRKKFGSKQLKSLMWKAATSTHPRAWEREMHNIKEVNKEASNT